MVDACTYQDFHCSHLEVVDFPIACFKLIFDLLNVNISSRFKIVFSYSSKKKGLDNSSNHWDDLQII